MATFEPIELKAVRDPMAAVGLCRCRRTLDWHIVIIVRLSRHTVENEMLARSTRL